MKKFITSVLIAVSMLCSIPAANAAHVMVWDHGSVKHKKLTTDLCDPSVLQHIQVTIPSAAILTMDGTPVTLIPGVPGKVTMLDKVEINMNAGSAAFTGGGVSVVQYHTGAVAATGTLAANQITSSTSTHNVILPVAGAVVIGDNLEMSNTTAVFAAGNGNLVLDIWYKQL